MTRSRICFVNKKLIDVTVTRGQPLPKMCTNNSKICINNSICTVPTTPLLITLLVLQYKNQSKYLLICRVKLSLRRLETKPFGYYFFLSLSKKIVWVCYSRKWQKKERSRVNGKCNNSKIIHKTFIKDHRCSNGLREL